MIKEKKIEVKTTNKNISFYKKYDFSIKSGDTLSVDIDKLSNGSKQKVTILCEKCGNEKIMEYRTYLKLLKDDKYYCSDCKYERIKETNLKN